MELMPTHLFPRPQERRIGEGAHRYITEIGTPRLPDRATGQCADLWMTYPL